MAQRKLEIVIAGDSRGAEKAFGRIEKSGKTMGQKLGSIGNKLTVGVTAPLVAGFVKAGKAAAEEGQEVAKLTKLLKNNVKATDEQVESVENWITKTQNAVGVADSELRPAFGKLVVATDDITRSQELLQLALDISAARGKSLSSVVDSLVRAENGQVAGLSRLGIQTKNAAGETLSFERILRNAREAMGGTALEAANTAQGSMEILRLKFEDIQEQIGTAVLPILVKLTGGLSKLANGFTGLTETQQSIALWSAGVLVALGPITKAIQALTFVIIGASGKGGLVGALALLAKHPVIVFLVLVGGAAVWAYMKFEKFRDVVHNVVIAVALAMNDLRDAVVPVIDFIGDAIHDVISGIEKAIELLGKLRDALPGKEGDGGGGGGIPGLIGKGIKNIGIPGTGITLGDIPGFHSGGMFRASTPGGEGLAMLKDREIVTPEGGITVNVATNANPYEIGREVMWQLGRV